MRFTDNASIATDTMVNDDILAGTDVSAGTDRKFTLANLAAWLLNKFTGLSLAGSNQTVKSALDSLNSKSMKAINAGQGTDANTTTAIGWYYGISWQNLDSGVTSKSGFLLVLPHATNNTYIKQIYTPYNTNEMWVRTDNDGTFTSWEKQPTRAEIDALSEIYTGTTNFTSIDPIQPNNARGIGAWLDAKVHAQISTFSTGEVHLVAGVNDSVAYGASFYKASDSYYAGIVWSYHNNARNTAWYFKYSNGTYKLRPLAKPIAD